MSFITHIAKLLKFTAWLKNWLSGMIWADENCMVPIRFYCQRSGSTLNQISMDSDSESCSWAVTQAAGLSGVSHVNAVFSWANWIYQQKEMNYSVNDSVIYLFLSGKNWKRKFNWYRNTNSQVGHFYNYF